MKIKNILVGIVTIFVLLVSAKSDKPAYRVFNSKGHAADYGDILKAARNADVVFSARAIPIRYVTGLNCSLRKIFMKRRKAN